MHLMVKVCLQQPTWYDGYTYNTNIQCAFGLAYIAQQGTVLLQ